MKLQLSIVALIIVVTLITHFATVLWLAWPMLTCETNCTELVKRP
jgi:hypothetical protein